MFKIYHSNDLDILAKIGLHITQTQPLLNKYGNPDFFKKEHLIIQSEGMKTYIYQTWAQENGICTQVDGEFLWTYIWTLGRLLIDELPKINPYDISTLTYNLMGIFEDKEFLKQIEEDKTFAPLFKYLGLNNDDKSKSNQTKNQICEQIINNLDSDLEKRLYSLSANLADIFDKYQVYRMNWIEEWDLEKPNSYENWIKELNQKNKAQLDPKDFAWQAKLWHEFIRENYVDLPQNELYETYVENTSFKTFDRTSILKKILNKLSQSPIGSLKDVLPERIFVYGINSLSPIILDIFMALGRHIDVHYMFLNPCSYYWGDITSSTNVKLLKKLLIKEINASQLDNIDKRFIKLDDFNHEEKDFSQRVGENTAIFNEGSLDSLVGNIGNELLLSYGKLGQDNFALLVERASNQTFENLVGEISAFVPPITDDNKSNIVYCENDFDGQLIKPDTENENSPSLLDILKNDIYENIDLSNPLEIKKRHINKNDTSLVLRSSSSKLREVQEVYDYIVDLFVKDPTLRPRDIIVMTPNIKSYAPFINAVFSSNNITNTHLPFAICDRTLGEESDVMDNILKLMKINQKTFTSIDALELLKFEELREAFNIKVDDLKLIEELIRNNNILQGLNEQDIRKQSKFDIDNGEYPLTFSDGLSRLLMGSLMPNSDDNFNIYNTHIEADAVSVLGNFYQFIKAIENLSNIIDKERSIEEWQDFINEEILTVFFKFDRSDIYVQREIAKALNDAKESFSTLLKEPHITLYFITKVLENVGLSKGGFSKFLRSDLNFCTFVPMRSIPFKHILLIGMNDGDFPRNPNYVNFDLMSAYFERGDRSSRNDDRYMFLEAILSAEESLYISYIGKKPSSGDDLNPSIVVSELLDYIEDTTDLNPKAMIKQTSFNMFDDSNFKGDDSSYQIQWFDKSFVNLDELNKSNLEGLEINEVNSPLNHNKNILNELRFSNYFSQNKDLNDATYFYDGLFLPGRLEPKENGYIEINLDDFIAFWNKPLAYFYKNILKVDTYQDKDLKVKEEFTINNLDERFIINNFLEINEEKIDEYLDTLGKKGSLPLLGCGEYQKEKLKNIYKENFSKLSLVLQSINLTNISINYERDLYEKDIEEKNLDEEAITISQDLLKLIYGNENLKVRIVGEVSNVISSKHFIINKNFIKGETTKFLENLINLHLYAMEVKDNNSQLFSLNGNKLEIDNYLESNDILSHGIFELLVNLYLIGRLVPLPLAKSKMKSLYTETQYCVNLKNDTLEDALEEKLLEALNTNPQNLGDDDKLFNQMYGTLPLTLDKEDYAQNQIKKEQNDGLVSIDYSQIVNLTLIIYKLLYANLRASKATQNEPCTLDELVCLLKGESND